MSRGNKMKEFGIGTDIENIERFKNKEKHFLNKIFTKKELEYCFSKKNYAAHLAARFAGKEAVVKALSNIADADIGYNQIEIINNKKGVPIVKLDKFKIKLSLSHCKDKAIAFAIIEK